MLVRLTVRELVLVSWAVNPDEARLDLPRGCEPVLGSDGRALVSLTCLRNERVAVGPLPGPPFGQVTLRTYVRCGGEEGLFLLAVRVGAGGLAGAFLGMPVRPARTRVARGRVEAPGLGVSLRYRVHGAPVLPPLGGTAVGDHRVAFFFAAGVRRLESTHEPFRWEGAELTAPPRVDPVLALGFDVGEPVSVLYARETRFTLQLPAQPVALL